MRFAAIRSAAGTSTARLDSGARLLIPLDAADVAELLRRRPRRGSRPARRLTRAGCGDRSLPVVTNPSKIICVGLNYRTHIETGRELHGYQTLSAKFAETLKGPNDDPVLLAVSGKADRGRRHVIQVSCETGKAPPRRGGV